MFEPEFDLISRCLKREVDAEYELYHRFASEMFGICMRYAGNEMEAEDILQNGFIRLFCNLHQFRFEGTFNRWVQLVFVNTAINYYRSNLKFNLEVELTDDQADETMEDALSILSTKELLAMIQALPPGYRTIFNMFVIENYEHKEIAKLLGISEKTSKSQLHRAKNRLRLMLKDIER
ncbi:MAG: sigma-70 family RNA polymerase sigma factor [Bacteroidales bacterium]|nr:sigma-70 family RNA polymerase sigma factor [Bacteroidales bacterium]